MRLGAAHLTELVREIAPLVRGLLVREVLAEPPRDLVLVLARAAEGPPDWRVRISASGDAPRLHVQRGRFERHEGPLGPFFRAVQAELAGAQVRDLTQVAGDRIAALALRTADGEARTLIAELVGRHANLVLLGASDLVLHVLVPAPAAKADPRLVLGQPYAPPPGRAAGTAERPVSEVFPRPATAPPLPRGQTEDRAPLSWVVEVALGGQADEARHADLARHVTERAERKLKNARSTLFGLQKRAEASAGAERVQQDGELVKANLGRIPRGAASIDVEDLFDPELAIRRVVLDPKISPHANLERLFERAKKLERGRDAIAGEIALAQARIAELETLLAAARADDADLEKLEQEAVESGLLEAPQASPERRAEKPPPRLPYRTYQGFAGTEIRVGRTARDNDDLTFRHARGSDVWLHTADAPGSHVILPVHKGADPHPEELIDAAHLAVQFSPLQGATRARVHVARRKEVHKPRGAKSGLVTLSGGRILELRLQPERLQRLLRTHHPRPPNAQ